MGDTSTRPKSSLKVNKECPPDREINILLLGQTGVGKTTFINSLANYLINDILDEAINDEMQVIIPTSFSFTDPETFEEKLINIGNKNNHEKVSENGQSYAQQCQSFVFPIGDRNLRLIDTPGMGDTRGSEQDNKNLFEILTYVSHYEHLNGICIFLKPNEERLTIAFRLCIKQVLHYLHISASENIIFIFTNARSTFFIPGSSKKILQVLLNEYRDKNNLEIPFSKDNTFLLDNEPFHCLALCKNEIEINNEQMKSYQKSWDYTIREYERLLTYISQRPLHAVGNTLSLNEAEQLIRKLPRPIAETLRLIQQNIQLAKEYKQNLLQKQGSAASKLLQNNAEIVPLRRPRLVCVSKKCLQIIEVHHEKKVVYSQECHKNCYLDGIVQETIGDPRIAQCEVIDNKTEKCTQCGCSWKKHMHITYEHQTNLNYLDMSSNKSETNDNQTLLSFIDKHINDLQKEQADIEDIYNKLSKFLYVNAIYPFNDDILNYLQLFIPEERMKNQAGSRNDDVIDGLEKIMTKYENEMNIFKKTFVNEKDSINTTDMLNPEDTFPLVGILYRLPINGQKIREQVNILKVSEDKAVKRMENFVKLPEKAASSRIMNILKSAMAGVIQTRI